MSKITCELKWIELQAIKHALESQIKYKKWVKDHMPRNPNLSEKMDIDIKQEEKLIEEITLKIDTGEQKTETRGTDITDI